MCCPAPNILENISISGSLKEIVITHPLPYKISHIEFTLTSSADVHVVYIRSRTRNLEIPKIILKRTRIGIVLCPNSLKYSMSSNLTIIFGNIGRLVNIQLSICSTKRELAWNEIVFRILMKAADHSIVLRMYYARIVFFRRTLETIIHINRWPFSYNRLYPIRPDHELYYQISSREVPLVIVRLLRYQDQATGCSLIACSLDARANRSWALTAQPSGKKKFH